MTFTEAKQEFDSKYENVAEFDGCNSKLRSLFFEDVSNKV